MGSCNAQLESVKSELKMCKADAGGADAESRKKLARAAGDEDKMKAKEEGEKAALEGKVKDEEAKIAGMSNAKADEAAQRQKEKDECKISSMSAAKKECDARVDTLNQQIGMLQAKAGGKGGGSGGKGGKGRGSGAASE